MFTKMLSNVKIYTTLDNCVNLVYVSGKLLGIIILSDHIYLQLYIDTFYISSSLKYVEINIPLKYLDLRNLNIESVFSKYKIDKIYIKKSVFTRISDLSSILYKK
jgi:hypothetical protein